MTKQAARIHATFVAGFVLLCSLVIAGLLVLSDKDGDSVPPAIHPGSSLRQPYGGCDEAWRYPHSRGYRDCQALGLVP